MIEALLYLQAQSLRNLVWARVRRLRRPKYLLGALFGALYFGSFVVRPLLIGTQRGKLTAFSNGLPPDVWESVGAAALLLLILLGWVLPQKRAGLIFSEAEIAFLFPAPVSRANLIRYKLLKSQLGILFTVGFFSLLSLRFGGAPAAAQRAVGLWILLSLLGLHSIGVSFTHAVLLGRHGVAGKRRAVVLLAALAGLGGGVWWVAHSVPALQAADLASVNAMVHYVRQVTASPPGVTLLFPFRIVARVVLAVDGNAFRRALGPALALLAAHYFWVMRMNVAFEESSIDASRRHAARLALMRGGNRWQTKPRRKARAPFALAPSGSAAIGILWKNLISAGQVFSLRFWLAVTAWGIYMGYVFRLHSHGSLWLPIVATGAAVLAGISVLAGPQLLRQDFRQDMSAVDLLKTYPVSGRQLALGQILAPLVILTGFQWLLLGVAGVLFSNGRDFAPLEYGACLALLAPALDLLMLLLPNAAALLYPGWFTAAQSGGRDLEAIGQRMLLSLGLLATFAITMVPAGLTFVLIDLVAAPLLLPEAAALPAASLGAALVLGAEGLAGIAALGYLFERFDPSAETA